MGRISPQNKFLLIIKFFIHHIYIIKASKSFQHKSFLNITSTFTSSTQSHRQKCFISANLGFIFSLDRSFQCIKCVEDRIKRQQQRIYMSLEIIQCMYQQHPSNCYENMFLVTRNIDHCNDNIMTHNCKQI